MRLIGRFLLGLTTAAILVGCGVKGALTLPKPQFPAPPEETEPPPRPLPTKPSVN